MPSFFVYGALMTHPHVLVRGEAACIRDHAVRFTLRGLPFFEPAFAALERAPGELAWGVVVDLEDAEWRRTRRHEVGYSEKEFVAVTKSGAEKLCRALVLPPHRRAREGRPSARYARLLLRGAEHHALPEAVCARYRALVEAGSPWSMRLTDLLKLAR